MSIIAPIHIYLHIYIYIFNHPPVYPFAHPSIHPHPHIYLYILLTHPSQHSRGGYRRRKGSKLSLTVQWSQGQSGLPSTVGEGVVCVLGWVERQRENKERRRRREERKRNRKKRILVLFWTVYHCLVLIYNPPNSTSGMLRLQAWATGSSRDFFRLHFQVFTLPSCLWCVCQLLVLLLWSSWQYFPSTHGMSEGFLVITPYHFYLLSMFLDESSQSFMNVAEFFLKVCSIVVFLYCVLIFCFIDVCGYLCGVCSTYFGFNLFFFI